MYEYLVLLFGILYLLKLCSGPVLKPDIIPVHVEPIIVLFKNEKSV